MKSLLLLAVVAGIFHTQTALADSALDCKEMDHPRYQAEYKACLKAAADADKSFRLDCEGMDHPNYQAEYKACLKLAEETEKKFKKVRPLSSTQKSVCDKLKSTFDIYDSYVFAQQLGIGTAEAFNGKMYRNLQDKMEKNISANCSSKDAQTLIADTEALCSTSCAPLANQASPKDKKKAVEMANNCQAICKIDASSKKHLLQGLNSRSTASADCENPTKDSISNTGPGVVKWFNYIDKSKDSAEQDKPLMTK